MRSTARDVGLDRLGRDPQPRGDLLVEVAAGDVAAAPRARAASAGRARGRPRPAGSRRANASSTKPASRGEKTASPSATRLTASASSVAGDRLGHVAAGAGADDRDHVLGGVGDATGRGSAARAARARPARITSTPAAAGHVDVEQHDVGLRARGSPRPRPRRSPASPQHVDEPLELGAHAGAEELVVVDDHDAGQPALIRSRPAAARRRSSTSVPPPGVEWTVGAAAVALHAPDDRLAHAAAVGRHRRRGRNPGPRSRTKTSTRPSSTSA